MIDFHERYGEWALVTGSAIGLGEAFCEVLAKKGLNLVMVDNRERELSNLSEEIKKRYGIITIPVALDLYQDDSGEKIMETVRKYEVRLMLYIAAYSRIKKFENFTESELNHFVSINISTPIKLVHSFSKYLIEANQRGGILLMSSLAGLLGMQYIVPYAASKAFTWNLAESLYHELRPYKIDVMACIAGATATEAYLGTNPQYGVIKPQVQQPSRVAEIALQKLGKKALFISGFSNRWNYFILTRILPRKWASIVANKTMKKMYSDNVGD